MKNKKRAFTIVELVIVIGVIGILSAILIPTFTNLTAKAKETALKANLSNAYRLYAADDVNYHPMDEVYLVPKDSNTGYIYDHNEWSVEEHSITGLKKISDELYNGYYIYVPVVINYLPVRSDYENYFKLNNDLYLIDGLKFAVINAEQINGNYYCLGNGDDTGNGVNVSPITVNPNGYVEWDTIRHYFKYVLKDSSVDGWSWIYFDSVSNPNFRLRYSESANEPNLQPDTDMEHPRWRFHINEGGHFEIQNDSLKYLKFGTNTKMTGSNEPVNFNIYYQPKSVLDYVITLFDNQSNFSTIRQFLLADSVVLSMFQNESDYNSYRDLYESWSMDEAIDPYE